MRKRIIQRIYGDIWERRFYMCRPCIKGENIYGPVAVFCERMNDGGETEYIIAPLWDNFKDGNKYGFTLEDDFPFGVNMDLHQDEYVYGELPPVVEKRIPHINNYSPEFLPFFNKLKSNFYDPVDILQANYGQCLVDKFVFIPMEDMDLCQLPNNIKSRFNYYEVVNNYVPKDYIARFKGWDLNSIFNKVFNEPELNEKQIKFYKDYITLRYKCIIENENFNEVWESLNYKSKKGVDLTW